MSISPKNVKKTKYGVGMAKVTRLSRRLCPKEKYDIESIVEPHKTSLHPLDPGMLCDDIWPVFECFGAKHLQRQPHPGLWTVFCAAKARGGPE